jgi:hypothetical protein
MFCRPFSKPAGLPTLPEMSFETESNAAWAADEKETSHA